MVLCGHPLWHWPAPPCGQPWPWNLVLGTPAHVCPSPCTRISLGLQVGGIRAPGPSPSATCCGIQAILPLGVFPIHWFRKSSPFCWKNGSANYTGHALRRHVSPCGGPGRRPGPGSTSAGAPGLPGPGVKLQCTIRGDYPRGRDGDEDDRKVSDISTGWYTHRPTYSRVQYA